MGKKQNNQVKEITPMEVDFPQWYTDVISKTELCDYSPVGLYGHPPLWLRHLGKHSEVL